ncbi:MAG: flavodoxin family protein [Deltaproteobacteria bacterium]|nr:flavodoxin family protein [Deltaproteobacteria bacterium]MBW1995102.1 flavodoxin family protein [Deltaproteobacteria bacterium]MBW2153578.1 flavodoxin family protein [Deltaproteobacteria bacterium]
MATNEIIVGLVGSPNRDGRTYQLVTAALEGADRNGAETELIQMADHVVAACKDCIPWVCRENLKCTYDDEAFEFLSKKVLNCAGLILGTPVYWWDTSGMVKYFILKMFRVYARSAPLQGLPAFGIGIAGGTGNGLVSGLRPVYHFFQMMQMRALDPVPATRFNFDSAIQRSGELGARLAAMAKDRKAFSSLEERLLYYDALPYLGLSRAEERRLLADYVTQSLPEGSSAEIARGLARADTLAAAGKALDSLAEVSKVYEAGLEVFEAK